MALRPLSQTGFPNAPKNPRQRDGIAKFPRDVLTAFNETQEARQLHPTKGWRTTNVKRTRAQMLVSLTFQGAGLSTAAQARFLATGYLGQLGSI